MTKTKSTKRALLLSALALLMCVSMLIGTTFAWFTETIESTNNIIKSGNLDVKLEYATVEPNGEKSAWKEVKTGTAVFDENALWEPGYTEVIYLRVSNAGSLALKYQLGVNIVSETTGINVDNKIFKLSDYIKFGVVEKDTIYANRDAAREAVANDSKLISAGYSKSNELMPQGKGTFEEYVTLVVYMPEETGNEANYIGNYAPEITLGINMIATQLTYESDSFDDQYDQNASYPGQANTATELIEALKEGKNVTLGADIYLAGVNWEPIASYSGTLDGAGHTIHDLSGENGLFETIDGATIKNLNLEGVAINATSNHTGAVAGTIAKNPDAITVIDNVTVSGTINGGDYYTGGLIGASSAWHATISNCVNNADVTASGQQVGGILGYAKRNTVIDSCVNTGTVTGGLFVGGILGLAAGDDENPDLSVVVKNCENTGNISETNVTHAWAGGVADIVGFVGREGGKTPSVMTTFHFIDNTVREGQKVYGRIGNVSGGTDYITVYDLSNVEGYSHLYTDGANGYYVYDAQGLISLNNWINQTNSFEKTFNVMSDINASGYTWNCKQISPNGHNTAGLTFNGNGHTISNLTIAGGGLLSLAPNGTYATEPTTFKDITFDNATVTGDYHVGVVWGQVSGDLVLNNVHVKNSNITGAYNVGGLVGSTGEFAIDASVKYVNCSVTNTTLTANGAVGGDPTGASAFMGRALGATSLVFEGNNVAENITYVNENGLVGGGIYGYTTWANDGFTGTGVCDSFTVWNGISVVTGDNGFAAAIQSGASEVILPDGTYTMPTSLNGDNVSLQGKTVAISGTKDTVVDVSNVHSNDQFVIGATIVFDGVTLKFNTNNIDIYKGFANVKEIVFRNCDITGLQMMMADKVTFENCKLDSSVNTAPLGEPHSVWTNSSKEVNFIGCEFIYGDRAVNVYRVNGTGTTAVNFTDCTFTTTSQTSKGAVEINSSVFTEVSVNFTKCTAPEYGTMVGISGWDDTNGATATVTVNGEEITPNKWEK